MSGFNFRSDSGAGICCGCFFFFNFLQKRHWLGSIAQYAPVAIVLKDK